MASSESSVLRRRRQAWEACVWLLCVRSGVRRAAHPSAERGVVAATPPNATARRRKEKRVYSPCLRPFHHRLKHRSESAHSRKHTQTHTHTIKRHKPRTNTQETWKTKRTTGRRVYSPPLFTLRISPNALSFVRSRHCANVCRRCDIASAVGRRRRRRKHPFPPPSGEGRCTQNPVWKMTTTRRFISQTYLDLIRI